jgi:dihydroneopterin aldolase
MRDTFTITLKAMRFLARVGTLPSERENPQPVEVDVTITCRDDGGQTFVDYRELFDITRARVLSGHTQLLEELARDIGVKVAAIPGVRSTRVALRKTAVPLPGPVQYSEVVFERNSDD